MFKKEEQNEKETLKYNAYGKYGCFTCSMYDRWKG